jgi:hypothetical protein
VRCKFYTALALLPVSEGLAAGINVMIAIFGDFRRFSAIFGDFRRFSAIFGIFRRQIMSFS